jgi:hypothetical protein
MVRGERAQVLLRFDNEAVLVLLGELSRSADDLIDKPGQIHRLGLSTPRDRGLACFRPFNRIKAFKLPLVTGQGLMFPRLCPGCFHS